VTLTVHMTWNMTHCLKSQTADASRPAPATLHAGYIHADASTNDQPLSDFGILGLYVG